MRKRAGSPARRQGAARPAPEYRAALVIKVLALLTLFHIGAGANRRKYLLIKLVYSGIPGKVSMKNLLSTPPSATLRSTSFARLLSIAFQL